MPKQHHSITIAPGQYAVIPTGIHLQLPPNIEVQIRPRSSLASKFGVTVLNTPGTVDPGYRGETKVILINHGNSPFIVESVMRIAQFVFSFLIYVSVTLSKTIDTHTDRNEKGFGSTNI